MNTVLEIKACEENINKYISETSGEKHGQND
jgi:hypothetical protein